MNRIVSLERAEIEAFADIYAAASPEVRAAAGLSVTQVGSATLLAANQIDVLALNRLMGLGFHEVPSDVEIREMLSVLAAKGAPRYFVPVAPVDNAPATIANLERAGLTHYNNWVRLHRTVDGLDALPRQVSALEVREIDRADAPAFGRIVATAFQYPPAIAPLTESPVGRPGWHHYLAFEGNAPIAAAAMFVAGDAAWFGLAATDAGYRRRGAQHALVMQRLEDAARAGCRWISVETAEDTVTKDAPSFRNLRRLGFEVAYRRPNYLWVRNRESKIMNQES